MADTSDVASAGPVPAADDRTGARRVCLLTGAGSLLGSAWCRAHVADLDIVAVYRNTLPAVPTQDDSFVDPLDPRADLPENRNRVYAVQADLEVPGQVERVVDIALARFGRVDLLVNNAAYTRLHPPGLVDLSGVEVDLQRHVDVNVAIPLRLAATLAQRFWQSRDRGNRSRHRNIVNVSSLSGSRVYPGGQAVYAMAKAAQNQLTRHLAAEFAAFGVRVNAVAPNAFPSVVAVDDVVAAIDRLDGSDVTGRILAVDAT